MTKKMDVIFGSVPPKRPLTSLAAICDDWRFRFQAGRHENHRRDHVVTYCAKARTFKEAVDRACASRAENGKCHNHQSRVREVDRRHFARLILRRKEIIGAAARAGNFDAMHAILEDCAPVGIGPVTIYDVATRIAAYLDIEVESLHLHAGVKVGWELLIGCKTDLKLIPRGDLPAEFRKLPTDEVEDLLCTYRDFLKPWLKPNGKKAA